MRFYLRNDYKDRPGMFYIAWTDEHGRGCRASTRTRDHGAAQLALAKYILEHDTPRDQRPENVTVEAVMLRYWHHHGRTRFAKDAVRYALAHVTKQLPKVTVAEFDRARQRRFIRALADQGMKPSSIARYLGVIAAALNRAKDQGEIVSVPELEKPELEQSQGVEPFSLDELRAVMAAATSESERLMVLLWIGTGCRPGAVLDLTWDRVDFAAQAIDFRVPGRRMTKKRRTLPPMAPSLAAYLEAKRSVGYVIVRRTKKAVRPLAGFKMTMRRLAKRAGVEGSAYRIRKSVATWLRSQGVPEAEVLAMLGHRFGSSETERYARPEYLVAARAAIEQLLHKLAPPWLGLARSWQGASRNPLMNQAVGCELVMTQVSANDEVYGP